MRPRAHLLGPAGILSLAFLLAGCADEQNGAPEDSVSNDTARAADQQRAAACQGGQRATDRVAVELRGQGSGRHVTIVAEPPGPVKLKQGTQGSLPWEGDQPFVVIFKPTSGRLPVQAATAASGSSGGKGPPARAVTRTNPQAPCGVYEYSVAVWDGSADRLFALDPPIWIVP